MLKTLSIPSMSLTRPPKILYFFSINELNITNAFVRPIEKVVKLQENFDHFSICHFWTVNEKFSTSCIVQEFMGVAAVCVYAYVTI